MTTVDRASVVCPKCGTLFVATKIMSCGYASKTKDFMPNYWGYNPLPHFVHTCPKCMFSSWPNNFKDATSEAIYEEPSIPGWKKYVLLAENLLAEEPERGSVDPSVIAVVYHKAAWTARSADADRENEKECLKKALKFLTLTLKGDLEKDEKAIFTYLCGEINRLLGSFDEAIHFFSMVQNLVDKKGEQSWLLKWTEEQRAFAEKKDNKVKDVSKS